MNAHDVGRSSTMAGLPISPGLGPAREQARILRHPNALDNRTLFIVDLTCEMACKQQASSPKRALRVRMTSKSMWTGAFV